MIEIQKGKNTIFINTGNKYYNYEVILQKIGKPDLKLVGYLVEESDLYIKLEFIINTTLSGEYDYSVKSGNIILDKGIAKFSKQENINYKQYGKN